MRMYGYLREPFKTNKKDRIYKVMLHQIKKQGVYAYLYTSRDALFCSFDYHYPDIDNARENWDDEIDEQGWIVIDDPPPGSQHDCILPIRVKGRDTGNPQWGQFEILENGQWVDYKL